MIIMYAIPAIATAEMITYLLCLVIPSFIFLIVALAKDYRRYKAPIYFGFVASIVTSIILYILLPVIKNFISMLVIV